MWTSLIISLIAFLLNAGLCLYVAKKTLAALDRVDEELDRAIEREQELTQELESKRRKLDEQAETQSYL